MDFIIPTEPFIQTQVYDLANGGDLIFERDLFASSEFLGRSPPVFYGGRSLTKLGANSNGSSWLASREAGVTHVPPDSALLRENNRWMDRPRSQEALARLLPFHPVLRHHVDHMDFMLFETRAELDNSRSAANHTHHQLNQYAETIKVIAKERRTLRQLVAKRDSTIHRLKAKLAVLKETIATQAEQLQILEGEGEGEDIQGDGYSYVSNDDDYEEEDEGDLDFHQHLPAGMDTTFPLRIDG
ncbi:hypothetical protein QYE76_057024 [Lolium multiflorum]|uniref:Uncharacterized protein n=1 Tax=Lolium multiflorum TaxID=4521 RepID=A0AAD8T497_LOLMU|nr:hypothetical protein QYE76_057024 [Lolium multiflorum]